MSLSKERITFSELQHWVLEVAEERGPALNHRGAALCQEGRTPTFTTAGTSAASIGLPPTFLPALWLCLSKGL